MTIKDEHKTIAARFSSASLTYHASATIQRSVAERLSVMLTGDEAALGSPAVSDHHAAIARPVPLGARVELLGRVADFTLGRRVAIEVRRTREHPREQERRVDRGEFAAPRPAAVSHVEEVVVEAAMAGADAPAVAGSIAKEAQGRECAGDRLGPREVAALHGDRLGRQGESDRGDAAVRTGARVVRHEAVRLAREVDEVAERVSL